MILNVKYDADAAKVSFNYTLVPTAEDETPKVLSNGSFTMNPEESLG